MELLRSFKGEGWLRILGASATTAHYELSVMLRESIPALREVIVRGHVSSEGKPVMGARLGRAVLTLEDGSSHNVDVTEITHNGMELHFLPPLRLRS